MKTGVNDDLLRESLFDLLKLPVHKKPEFKLISRQESAYTSTFPIEIVTCQLAQEKPIVLFCKYLAGLGPNNYGHRGGVEYEIKVYKTILKNLPLSRINFYGHIELPNNNNSILVLEYLDGSINIEECGHPEPLPKAAEWIAKFHSIFKSDIPEFITIYDQSYYNVWVEKVKRLTESIKIYHPWLFTLCDFFQNNIGVLLNTKGTFIHGEYYPKNILIKDETIYPVDWESAAVAAGEIDLASLIDGWDEHRAKKAIDTYKAARSTEDFDKEGFEVRLKVAQIYFHFRWLEGHLNQQSWRLNHLHQLFKTL